MKTKQITENARTEKPMRESLNLGLILLSLLIAACATESHQSQPVQKSEAAKTAAAYRGVRKMIAVGKFDNRSGFLRGVFSEGPDRLASQAKTLLVSHLQQTGRFSVLDRDNLDESANEIKFSGKKQKILGADYAITGDVTEFGRKETGDHQLFGILGSGKKQVAYSKVTLSVVEVATSEVIYSASGAGEYALSNREVIGFGGTASYDSTLNGKVLDLAMREAIDRLVEGLESNKWALTYL